MHPNYYLNKSTGEVVFTHKEAMEFYRQGYEIEIWRWSNEYNRYWRPVTWEH